MSDGRIQRVGGKILRAAGKLARACCCTTYTPGVDCTECPAGTAPTAWEATVAGMSLCCSWWYWVYNYGGPNYYDFVAYDMTGIDPNGTFCLYQCAYDSCLWDSSPIPWTGTIKFFEELGIASLPADKCGGTPDWTVTSTEGSPTIYIRWILNLNSAHGFTGLIGLIEIPSQAVTLIFYRAAIDCTDSQEIAPTSDCFADLWSAQDGDTMQKYAWCNAVSEQVSTGTANFVGHDGGTVAIVKGCGT
jgi:hypothetical protein